MPKSTVVRRIDLNLASGGGGGVLSGGGGTTYTTDHGALSGLGDDDHAQYHNDTRGDARYPLQTLTLTAGNGLTGGGTLAADRTFTVGAGLGITVNADDVALTTPGTLTYATTNSASGNHTHAITAASDVSAPLERILKSSAAGALTLAALNATTQVSTPTLTAAANLTLSPAGDLLLNPTGNDVLPVTNYDLNLGAINLKYLTLHAAELWVETLVAQETMATIGGRILVGPTTTLVADYLIGAGTTIDVKHNNLNNGDVVYLESNGKVEFMSIVSGGGAVSGGYRYTVSRNLDGSGQNDWYAGDAVFNTGQTGNGFIDLYSLRGVRASSEAGPTIVGNVRNSSTFNDWSPRWAVGNLNGLYGYSATTYGLAAGNASGTWIGADATNGFRVMSGSTARLQADTSGNLYIKNSSGTNVISLTSSGASEFSGPMTLGSGGGIYQGSGTFASPTTGLRVWNDSGVGRIGGYNTGALQWYGATDGKFYFGSGVGRLDAGGIQLESTSVVNPAACYGFSYGTYDDLGGLYGINNDVAPARSLTHNVWLWARNTTNGSAETVVGVLTLKCDTSSVFVEPSLAVNGDIMLLDSTPTLTLGSGIVSTGDASIKVGSGRTGSGYAYIDFVGDTTYTTAGLRIIRNNSGANAGSDIIHAGTGDFRLRANQAASILFQTAATTRMTVGAAGEVAIGTTPQTGWELYVAGDIGATGVVNAILRAVAGTAPTGTADSSGTAGDIRWDANYLYIKNAGGWRRIGLGATW